MYERGLPSFAQDKIGKSSETFRVFLLNNCSYTSKPVLSLLVECVNLHKTSVEMYNSNYRSYSYDYLNLRQAQKLTNGNHESHSKCTDVHTV